MQQRNIFIHRTTWEHNKSNPLKFRGKIRNTPFHVVFSQFVCFYSRAKMMHMTLYWGKRVTLLIDSWKTDSWVSYALSLLACLVVAAFYQYLENRRIRLKLVAGERRQSPEIQTPLLRWNKVARNKVAEAVLFGVNSAIGYLLMLAIMSFNGGVFLAIVVGLTLGYLFFRGQSEDAALVVDNSCACA